MPMFVVWNKNITLLSIDFRRLKKTSQVGDTSDISKKYLINLFKHLIPTINTSDDVGLRGHHDLHQLRDQ